MIFCDRTTIVQRLYDEIFDYIKYYNESLSHEILEKITIMDIDNPVVKGLLQETLSHYEGIKYKHNELKNLSTNLKEKFDSMCDDVFSEDAGFCHSVSKFYNLSIKRIAKGHRYKPLRMTDEIITSAEWFKRD